jgi:hypothetical protein
MPGFSLWRALRFRSYEQYYLDDSMDADDIYAL